MNYAPPLGRKKGDIQIGSIIVSVCLRVHTTKINRDHLTVNRIKEKNRVHSVTVEEGAIMALLNKRK
jgi:hypothetical protein